MNVIKTMFTELYNKLYLVYKKNTRIKKYNKDARFLNEITNTPNRQRVFFFGPTTNQNLGDRGQVYCIRNWIKENYPGADIYELNAYAIIEPKVNFVERFKSIYNPSDIIIFQSGYNVNDMGANHPQMHRAILENFPNAKILMMPESIYYHCEENMRRDALFYSMGKKFLFLARDSKSFEILQDMCPNLPKKPFPDIVTTLIGEYNLNITRTNKICLCRRDDNEKFYPEEDLLSMMERIKSLGCSVDVTDTTINASPKDINNRLQWYIEDVIKKYATYECMITDRFHGVVFSLIAGTPVVVIKTNNHKVTQALEWFKGVYDEYVFYAESLDDAVELVKDIKNKHFDHKMRPYFKENYYDKLKAYMDDVFNK